MTTRTEIIQKIVDLRNVEGRTEAEVQAFIAKADRLMQSYRIAEAEIALAEATGEVKIEIIESTSGTPLAVGRHRHKVQSCLYEIKLFNEVECVIMSDNRVSFVGDRPDVEMAHYLVDLIRDSMDREYASWRKSQQGVGRGAKGTFQLAMAGRVNERLRELRSIREREARELLPAATAVPMKELTSTALIVVAAAEQKKKEVDQFFRRAYPKLGRASGFQFRLNNNTAYSAGRRAGDRVGLGRPVTTTQTQRISA